MDKSLSLTLWPTVSRPVCLGIKHPFGVYDQIFVTVRHLRVCSCGAPSLTRGRICRLQLLLALASGHSRVRGPWHSWPYFTVSDSRLPISSPPTTRRATVEVFDPASTQDWWTRDYCIWICYCSLVGKYVFCVDIWINFLSCIYKNVLSLHYCHFWPLKLQSYANAWNMFCDSQFCWDEVQVG
jgi:hypothetical protein